jgi:hypothetical protein
MKKLQHLCMAGVFAILLSTSTFAGDIATGGRSDPPPPPPPPPPGASELMGDTYIPGTQAQAIETFADIAVDLFKTMLTVF